MRRNRRQILEKSPKDPDPGVKISQEKSEKAMERLRNLVVNKYIQAQAMSNKLILLVVKDY